MREKEGSENDLGSESSWGAQVYMASAPRCIQLHQYAPYIDVFDTSSQIYQITCLINEAGQLCFFPTCVGFLFAVGQPWPCRKHVYMYIHLPTWAARPVVFHSVRALNVNSISPAISLPYLLDLSAGKTCSWAAIHSPLSPASCSLCPGEPCKLLIQQSLAIKIPNVISQGKEACVVFNSYLMVGEAK